MDALGMTGAQLGTLHAIFFLVYAMMQIPTGILVDRVGPRLTATSGASVRSGLHSRVPPHLRSADGS